MLVTYIPSVSVEGDGYKVTYTNNGGLINPKPIVFKPMKINIKNTDPVPVYTPVHSQNGNTHTISWTNTANMNNPAPVTFGAFTMEV